MLDSASSAITVDVRSHEIETPVSPSEPGVPPLAGNGSPDAARGDPLFTAQARHEISNALSAILLYAEAIRLRATQAPPDTSIIAASAASIRSQAELIWRTLEEARNPEAASSAPGA